jgi:hypothetical protein
MLRSRLRPRDPSDGMFGCFGVSGVIYVQPYILTLAFATQPNFFHIIYYFAHSEGVLNTSMEPKKEKKAAGINGGDINTRMTEIEASVKVEEERASYVAPMAPQEETNTRLLCRRG